MICGNMAKADLRVDWATHKAAKYACENWHYSGCLPAGKLVKVGVWESKQFIGVVVFGMGAGGATNGTKYGLATHGDMCELVRIALTEHKAPVSRIMALAIRFLVKKCPDLRMIISFADPAEGHHGGVYQAANWVYSGDSASDRKFVVRGRAMHPKSVHSLGWRQSLGWLKANIDPNAYETKTPGKHRYLMPLDKEMREQIAPLAKPYPKRVKQATTDDQLAGRQGSTDPHAPIPGG